LICRNNATIAAPALEQRDLQALFLQTLMLENNQPRHTVRAQGKARLFTHTEGGRVYDGRLLNYLSQNAAQQERSLLDHTSVASVGSSSTAAQMLENWLNAGASSAQLEERDEQDEFDLSSHEGYWPKTNFDDDANIHTERGRREVAGDHGPGGPGGFLRSLRSNAARNNNQNNRDETEAMAALLKTRPQIELRAVGGANGNRHRGERVETFANGSRVVKDSIGRVQEIVSDRGVSVVLRYDEKGHLVSFVRSDPSGTVHSQGEADGNGVLVRDGRGRVKAQGESMQVDAGGCVSIAREDGQFWSIDLVRSVHTERRLLPDANGQWVSMTALFCSDGFRMTTRFRPVQREAMTENLATSVDFSGGGDSGTYRFYGRDGSIIDFLSDSELEQLKPAQVSPPGSKKVPAAQQGKRQAGTAWESLREYVFNYLAAL